MPQRKNALKALRQNRTKHMQNLDIKTDLRKTIKNFISLIDTKKKSEAQAYLSTVYKKLDKAAKKHLLPKNTAARRKSHFTKLLVNKA